MGNIARVNIDLSRVEFIPDSEEINPVHRLNYGDVLFNTRNTLDLVGKVSIWREELPVAYYNSNILRLEFKPEYCGDSQYFGYALNSKQSIESIRALATGTTSVAAVYTRDLLKLEIPVPPKSEQRAITDALADADRLIANLRRLIAKKQAIKQGMMQQLLSGKTRLSGLTAPWGTTTIGDVCTTFSGGTPSTAHPEYYGGEFPWIASGDLNKHRIESVDGRITRLGLEWSAAKLVQAGTPLIALYGATAGVAAITQIDGAINQAILAMVPRKINAEFLYQWLSANRDSIIDRYTQGGQPNLSGAIVRGIEIPLPSPSEQQRIAGALYDADRQIATVACRLNKARAIKQGMMQDLLTGRTRLPVAEGAA